MKLFSFLIFLSFSFSSVATQCDITTATKLLNDDRFTNIFTATVTKAYIENYKGFSNGKRTVVYFDINKVIKGKPEGLTFVYAPELPVVVGYEHLFVTEPNGKLAICGDSGHIDLLGIVTGGASTRHYRLFEMQEMIDSK